MPTADISDEAIVRATGESWDHWLEVFSLMDAKNLPHKEIARKLYEDYKVPGWWCQMLTVKFEYSIGRRVPGHDKPGEYNTSVSVTLDGQLDPMYDKWTHALAEKTSFNTEDIDAVSLSRTDNWRYWKLKFNNGSRVYVNFSQKADDKVLVQVTHERLTEEKDVEPWKSYWRSVITEIFET